MDRSGETAPETYNPWSIVNLVFEHLAEQGLHPILGEGGDPGAPFVPSFSSSAPEIRIMWLSGIRNWVQRSSRSLRSQGRRHGSRVRSRPTLTVQELENRLLLTGERLAFLAAPVDIASGTVLQSSSIYS